MHIHAQTHISPKRTIPLKHDHFDSLPDFPTYENGSFSIRSVSVFWLEVCRSPNSYPLTNLSAPQSGDSKNDVEKEMMRERKEMERGKEDKEGRKIRKEERSQALGLGARWNGQSSAARKNEVLLRGCWHILSSVQRVEKWTM